MFNSQQNKENTCIINLKVTSQGRETTYEIEVTKGDKNVIQGILHGSSQPIREFLHTCANIDSGCYLYTILQVHEEGEIEMTGWTEKGDEHMDSTEEMEYIEYEELTTTDHDAILAQYVSDLHSDDNEEVL